VTVYLLSNYFYSIYLVCKLYITVEDILTANEIVLRVGERQVGMMLD